MLPEILYETDIQGNLTFVNRNAFNSFGYTQEDFESGLKALNMIIPDDQGRALENIQRIINGENIGPEEYTACRKDGSTFPVMIYSTAVIHENRPYGLRGIIIDITDQKQIKEALRESETRYRQLFENAPAGIYEIDLTTGRILSVNDAMCEYTGYTKDELLAINSLDLLTEESQKLLIERMAGYAAGGPVPAMLEYQARTKSGHEFWMSVNPKYFYKEGIPVRASVVAHDITERKQTEKALRESEEKYRAIIENMEDGYHEVDLKGNFTFFNESMRKILGYESKDLLGINNRQYADEENTRKVYKVYNRVYRTGDPVKNFEWQIIRKDGDRRDIEVSISLIRDTEGRPEGFRGIVRDTTNRKRAEKALRESEARWQFALEGARDGLWDWDAVTNRVYFSDHWKAMLGYDSHEVGDTLDEWDRRIHPDDKAAAYADLESHFRRETETYQNKHRLLCKDGSYKWILDRGKVIEWTEDGKPRRVIGTHTDISERKQAEEKLEASLSLLSASLESTADGILIVDRNGKIARWNQKFADMWKIPEEILFGRDDEKTINYILKQLADPEQFTARVRKLYEQPEESSFDQIEFTDGRIFERYSQPQKIESNIVGRVWSFRDITQRKKTEAEKRDLEERLNRAEKMEALGLLAGGVAHDLNNVLGIVVGYAEMLLMGADKSSPMRSKLVNIMEGAQKAAAIIQDMLTLARRGVPGRNILNLNGIVSDCQKSPEFDYLTSFHSSVQIKTELESDLLNISGSSVHLNKTIFNLVSNATEAMPKGGCVTIKTSNQYLDKPIQGYDKIQGGDYVVLSVSDTGEGINANDMKHIFEPFYTKKAMGRSGTGLGLAVVWGTVKDHNGYINVESEEGKGSAFTLYFPVTREELSAQRVAVSISEYKGKGESILVVDDVKGQRALAEEMLKKLNYTVTSVSSGEAALAYLKNHKVDLLVLDMIMDPGMDGLDTYRRVLEIHPEQKAIIVSGFSESDRVKVCPVPRCRRLC